ncbi:hypothetical protein D3C71_2029230 [compost metagenome]
MRTASSAEAAFCTVVTTRAPSARATWMLIMPVLDAPACTSTRSPALTSPTTCTARIAISNETGSAAICSAGRPVVSRSSQCSGTTMYWA